MTTPRVKDNDLNTITVTLDGKELRGWSYENEAERRIKIGKAREFVEGWLYGSEADPERFLLAYVSADTRIIGVEHPTDAAWSEVYAAHVALRDRLNERINEQDKCPVRAQASE